MSGTDLKGVAEAQAAQMVQRVRAAYILSMMQYQKRQNGKEYESYRPCPWWDGGWCQIRNRRVWRKPVWPSLARFMMEHALSPETYVHVIFASLGPHEHPPKPNQLGGESYYRRYQRIVASGQLEDDIRLQFEIQKNLVRKVTVGNMDLYKTRKGVQIGVLCSPEPIHPLVRYCLAVREGFEDLAERFFPRAAVQYMEAPDVYDKVWKEWIPPGFRERAEDHYRRLCLALDDLARPTR